MTLRHRETIDVGIDGEQIEVWNALNVTMAYQVRGGNPSAEKFPSEHVIEMLGGGTEPEYVTTWVAEALWHEVGIDLGLFNSDGSEEFDIEVVDIESEDVIVL